MRYLARLERALVVVGAPTSYEIESNRQCRGWRLIQCGAGICDPRVGRTSAAIAAPKSIALATSVVFAATSAARRFWPGTSEACLSEGRCYRFPFDSLLLPVCSRATRNEKSIALSAGRITPC